MSKKSELHIGSIGGNLSVGGDIVAGDKTTTGDSSITIINYGFKKEEDKVEFVSQIDELISMINQIISHMDKIEGFDKNKKLEIINEITKQVKTLKTAKEEADGFPVGQEAPKEKAKTIEGCLDKTKNLMGKLQKTGAKIAGFGNKILPLVSKALVILVNVRTLFGLP
jgi:cob(I)alamin adenosyltransferase